MLAEPLIAMICNEAIGAVSEGLGDDFEDFGEAPWETQLIRDLQSGIALMKHTLGADEEHRVRFFRVETMLPIKLAASLGLNGTEMDPALGVMLQDELHSAIAQIAHAIEKQKVGVIRWGG